MQAHIVLAHPAPTSFNAQLAQIARAELARQGYDITVSNLYESDFDPCESARHYGLDHDARRGLMTSQKQAAETGRLAPEIAAEIESLDRADLLILQFPMWWHMPPAILKGWFDRVFVFGKIYDAAMRFETGRYKDRRALLSVTTGTPVETYAHNGRAGDISLMLWPVQFSLAYVGYTILRPFVSYAVGNPIRGADAEPVETQIARIKQSYADVLSDLNAIPEVPFNTTRDWGPDGRVVPSAPVYSPFIRHRETLDLG